MHTTSDSKAMTDVWAWRDEIYDELKELPLDELLAEVSRKAKEATQLFHERKKTPDQPTSR
ncbi:MAG: hypothetical protein WCG80_17945 [Spirochaetales bacterium]